MTHHAHLAAGDFQIPQEINMPVQGQVHAGLTYWNNTIYVAAEQTPLTALRMGELFRRSRTRGTLRIGTKWSMDIFNWSGMPSATSARIMIRWLRTGR